MTVFYEPGVDSNMRLQDAEDKDLTLDALENAEKINPGDTDDLYGIFDGKLENENYNALANHCELHDASNEELQSKWIELTGERFDLDSQHTSAQARQLLLFPLQSKFVNLLINFDFKNNINFPTNFLISHFIQH